MQNPLTPVPEVFRQRISEAKNYLKTQVKVIRELKERRKDEDMDWPLYRSKREYRHLHIAYCELRGTPRNKIENPSEHNQPYENLITKFKEKILTGKLGERNATRN